MMAVKVTFVCNNPPAVTENQSISFQVKEASSNVKDQGVAGETLDNFRERKSNVLSSLNSRQII